VRSKISNSLSNSRSLFAVSSHWFGFRKTCSWNKSDSCCRSSSTVKQ